MEEHTRREFFKKALLSLGGLIAALFSIPSIVYFLSPAWKRKEEGWIEIGPLSEIPLGQPIKVEYLQRKRDAWMTIEGKRSAWVVTNDRKAFDIFDPRCTHLGCPYNWDEGKKKFLCPCHNATFDITGKVLSGPPPRPLDRYASKVVNEVLYILPERDIAHG